MKYSTRISDFILLLLLYGFSASCSGSDVEPTPSPTPSPEPSAVSFTASISGEAPFKSEWGLNDGLIIMASDGSKSYSELIKPASISQDGRTATFTSKGTLPSDAGTYYAYMPDNGIVSFKYGTGWTTADMNSISQSPKTVLAAISKSGTFAFKPLYSAVKISLTSDKVKTLVFEGRQSEILNRENIISSEDMSVSPSPSPAFQPSASISGEVFGAGDYYVNLYPGLVLSDGYKVSGYDSKGVLVASSESTARLESGSGLISPAPDMIYIDTRTRTFNPQDIVQSFGVISDVHINGDVSTDSGYKFKNALTILQSQAKKDDSNGLDAVLVVGDLQDSPHSDISKYVETDYFKAIYESVLNPVKVPMIYTVGNHDVYGAWYGDVYTQALNISQRLGGDYFLTDTETALREQYQCRHCVVGDCHILCVTPYISGTVTYPSQVLTWLDETLSAVTAANPEKYVLLLTHPMIYDTVYGSLLGNTWYTKALTPILSKYPQVIVFGGHLHFPINDPRSIWQGDFTSIGCGSVRYMAIENGGYENMRSATVMKDAYDITTGHLLQIDGSGNIRVTRMYFSESAPFSGFWTLSYPVSDKSHLAPYRFDTRRNANTSPGLSSIEVTCTESSTGKEVKATFAAGSDDEFVHHYVVTLKKDGTAVSTKKILADFYHHADFSGMSASWSVTMGTFGAGEYELSLTAYDSWDAASDTLKKTFTIE